MANRPRITDPIEWIKDVINHVSEGGVVTSAQRSDAAVILQRAETARIEALSDEGLATELEFNHSPVVTAEIAKRLRAPKPVAPQALPAPVGSGLVTVKSDNGYPVILPEGYHLMTGVNLPATGIPCGCKYGANHSEEFFEVEPGGEPPVSGNTGIEGFEDPHQETPAETEPVSVLEKKE